MKRLFREHAVRELEGVGDASLGEWIEETAAAVHVRRRLSAMEFPLVGPVLDIRGTEEARLRLLPVSALLWRIAPDTYRAEAFGEAS